MNTRHAGFHGLCSSEPREAVKVQRKAFRQLPYTAFVASFALHSAEEKDVFRRSQLGEGGGGADLPVSHVRPEESAAKKVSAGALAEEPALDYS